MRDWAAGIETRNYGIKRNIDAGMLSEHMCSIAAFVLMAGALLFYSWVRSQIINTGYERQQLSKSEESLLRSQKYLILEEALFSNPENIDRIARTELNMAPLRPNQLVLSPFQDVRGDANMLAMANPRTASLRKPVLTGVSQSNQND